MLRASSASHGKTVAVQGVISPDEMPVGVECQDLLLAFAEAAVRQDEAALGRARDALAAELGPAALVDAAGIVGNFERMNRIADGCGIALGMLEFIADEVRQELDIGHFNSAANTTPSKRIKRFLMKLMARIMMRRMRRATRSR